MTLAPVLLLWAGAAIAPPSGGELRFCIRSDPKTFDPLQVTEEASDTVRYLTAGRLLSIDRRTQRLHPELAESWRVEEGGRRIRFRLRAGARFSDGSPFDSRDVAYTFGRLLDPKDRVPAGDSLRRDTGAVEVVVHGPREISLRFPEPVAGLELLFDEVPLLSSRAAAKEKAVLGPFVVSEHRPGEFVRLRRNPHYWKKDETGRALPYLDGVRLDVQQNREIEYTRFRRGEIHLISTLDSEMFERLAREMPAEARDAGLSCEHEMLWFNQVGSAPLPEYKKAWFRSTEFRRAVSEAIRRQDIVRLVYRGRAAPGVGPFSPAATPWWNSRIQPPAGGAASALQRLTAAGFRKDGVTLRDALGHAVEFSVVTNAGNRQRARMAALLQSDLAALGIRLHIVPLDFPSLIERITRTFHYEACLLGLTNVEADPNDQLNFWLSSSSSHPWNPRQARPETPWEAEIDRLMRAQAAAPGLKQRKAWIDRLQEIVAEQAPAIYLVHPHALMAVSRRLGNAAPAVFRPRAHWNVERLYLVGPDPVAP